MSSPVPAPSRRTMGLVIWINAIGATILVGSELALVAVSLDWAVAGILHLQRGIALGLLAIMLAGTAWACWVFFRNTLRAERRLAAGTYDTP